MIEARLAPTGPRGPRSSALAMLGPLLILAGVVLLIAVRKLGRIRLRIWQIMVLGAIATLVSGGLPPAEALRAIDVDVMLFLFGMFVVAQALERSGMLAAMAYRLFRGTRSVDALVLVVLFGMGAGSAVLMNDTVAIAGTPVVLGLARSHRVRPEMLLLALAFAITIGSVASPIGNPQNLLIALHGGVGNPFVTFGAWLILPTLLSLLAAYGVLRVAYRREFHRTALAHQPATVLDARLARIARAAFGLILLLIAAKVALVAVRMPFEVPLTAIALVPAALVLLASERRVDLVRAVDWGTLAFFAALFVVVAGVARAGIAAEVVARAGEHVSTLPAILLLGTGLSQLVSNVPLAALYLPVLDDAGGGVRELMALAAGSTVAGNLTILGAASNVIIVDQAERRAGVTLSFWTFARIGAPLTAVNLAVYGLWLALL